MERALARISLGAVGLVGLGLLARGGWLVLAPLVGAGGAHLLIGLSLIGVSGAVLFAKRPPEAPRPPDPKAAMVVAFFEGLAAGRRSRT